MNLVKTMAKKALSLISPQNDLLLKFSQSYLDCHNGENNSDPVTNDEEYLLRQVLPSKRGVVFDVGANVGNLTSFALSFQPVLIMHLFEHSFTTFEQCSQKILSPSVHLNSRAFNTLETRMNNSFS